MGALHRTPLFELHAAWGAKMVPFAGYEMPVQYPMGVMKEHLHTRTAAGLFDVSHMGQIEVTGPSWDAVALAFEALVPMDVLGLTDGRQRYGYFTNDAGGIEDDLMFARRGDALFVVVNAACKAQDVARMRVGMPDEIVIEVLEDRALLALQGPVAGSVIETLDSAARDMAFLDSRWLSLSGHQVWASRSGYTGEDGFEISVASDEAAVLATRLVQDADVAPIGLGARDSLRLEAGLCLYGQDIDADVGPVAAGLTWAIQKVRRAGGARAGGFPGADRVFEELDIGPAQRRVGLRPKGRAPLRAGVPLFAEEQADTPIGRITSGGFGPSVAAPVAMGYVAAEWAQEGTEVWGDLRGKRHAVEVAALPFVPANFKR